MIIETNRRVCNGQLLKWLLAAGTAWLARHESQINQMNVFPVEDGDTGSNMRATMYGACNAIDDMDDAHFGQVMQTFAQEAMMQSKGNSGTILSMLMTGFAEETADLAELDAASLARAAQAGADYAYHKITKPVEGTILTVARTIAQAAQNHVKDGDGDLYDVLAEMVQAAWMAVEDTPNLLDVLREAGVVDSGGMGLAYIVEGMKRILDGDPVSGEGLSQRDPTITDTQTMFNPLQELDPIEHYDVQFIIQGDALDVDAVRNEINAMGVSGLVYGSQERIKVHVHVPDPSVPIAYAAGLGELDAVVIENLHLQVQETRRRKASQPEREAIAGISVIAVVRGEGLKTVFRQYDAAQVIDGGQSMNPSVSNLLDAVNAVATQDVIILPNNSNVIMTAEQVAQMTEKRIRVVPSRTIPQGIAALLGYGDADDDDDLDAIVDAMRERMTDVITIEITTATRTVTLQGVQATEGDVIGLLNGKLVSAGRDTTTVLRDVLSQLEDDDYELAELYYGADIHADEAEALIEALEHDYPELEFRAVHGGQPIYPYIIGIE